jgi:hypothetical protein
MQTYSRVSTKPGLLINEWRQDYNSLRPRSSLGRMSPVKYKTTSKGENLKDQSPNLTVVYRRGKVKLMLDNDILKEVTKRRLFDRRVRQALPHISKRRVCEVLTVPRFGLQARQDRLRR